MDTSSGAIRDMCIIQVQILIQGDNMDTSSGAIRYICIIQVQILILGIIWILHLGPSEISASYRYRY
jgi:hypothetical protein